MSYISRSFLASHRSALLLLLLLALLFSGAAQAATEDAQLLPAEPIADGYFGYTSAVDGDTAVIGSSNGIAYIFTQTETGWSQQAELTLDDPMAEFGRVVAIEGDTIFVGAANEDCGDGNSGCGAVYIFTRSGDAWTQQARLVAGDRQPFTFFGAALAIDGDTLLVGAYAADCQFCGAAYVFTQNDGVWTQQTKLVAGDQTEGQFFGYNVSLDGDTAVIGAHNEVCDAGDPCGAVYVFVRSAGNWTEQARLTPTNRVPYSSFGVSVSLQGNQLLIGAAGDNCEDGTPSCGAAYVFTRSEGVWAEQARLSSSSGDMEVFGYNVTLAGNMAVIGAPTASCDAGTFCGAAYIFHHTADGWVEVNKLTASNAASPNYFGWWVALSGNTVIISAILVSCDAGDNCGMAYVYSVTPPPADETAPTILINSPADGAVYTLNDVVSADFSCADETGGSGVSSCQGSVANGAPIDTTTEGDHFFTVTATDVAGNNASLTHTYTVIVNQPPLVCANCYLLNEGEAHTLGGAVASDPNDDNLTLAWHVDSSSCSFDNVASLQPTLTCADNGRFTVTLTASDGIHTVSSDTGVIVANVAPTASAGANQTVLVNELVHLTGMWTDPAGGQDNDYSWTWDLDGDGQADSSGTAVYGQTADATTTFDTPGLYTLTFTVTDKDGGSGSNTVEIDVRAESEDCVSDCLRVNDIQLIGRTVGPHGRADGIVLVQDENGQPINKAQVTVTWTLPNGSQLTQTVATKNNGQASFRAQDAQGTYTLTVTTITLAGYSFDPDNSSVLSATITIP